MSTTGRTKQLILGFTGWIGGGEVFNHALSAAHIARLSAIGHEPPISAPYQEKP